MRTSFAFGAFALGAASLLGTGCSAPRPKTPDQQTAQRTIEEISLDTCPFPRGRSTPVQLYVAFDRHGSASHVEVGRDVDASLSDCIVATIRGAQLPPGEWEGAAEVTIAATLETDENGRTRWPFDRDAGARTLGLVEQAAACRTADEHMGHIQVVFEPSGRVSSAKVDEDITLASEDVRCLEDAYRRARVPPFAGNGVSVGKWFLVRKSRP